MPDPSARPMARPIARGRVVQVNVSRGGVPKLPVEGTMVRTLGLDGDGHTEPEPMHGGPDKAVSLYSIEAIGRVAADGHRAFPGAFGENLTLEGIEMDRLAAGDRLVIGAGGLAIELTSNASPCTTLQHWFSDGRFARISQKVHPEDARWYARVMTEGPVSPGDDVEVMRPD